MAKARNVTSSLLSTWLNTVPDQKKFFRIERDQLFCTPCGKTYRFSRISELNQHIKTASHCKNMSLQVKSGKQQSQLTEPRENEFAMELCEAFIAADIPFFKLRVPKLQACLEKHCKKIIPSETTLRRNVDNVYRNVISEIRDELNGKSIYLQIDEATDACNRFIVNVVVGELNSDAPKNPHLLMVKELPAANNATISQLVLDALGFLWPNASQSEISERFCLLLTDAVPYMIKAGKNLKKIYPDLLHVTCLAHGLNRVAEYIRSSFKLVDQLVANIKAVFKKAPSRLRKYKELYPDLPLPPEPVIVRWGTWLRSVNFISENYEALKTIVDSFDPNEAVCVRKAQKLFKQFEIRTQLAELSTNFIFILSCIEKLESRKLELTTTVDLIEDIKTKINNCTSSHGEGVRHKLLDVLSKNPDFEKMCGVANMILGKDTSSSLEIPMQKIINFKFCPLTSVEVERSFSMGKCMLSDRRQNFTLENFEKTLVCHYEEAILSGNNIVD